MFPVWEKVLDMEAGKVTSAKKVNLAEKELHPQRKGMPSARKYNAFKMLRVRPETYFRLQEFLEDHRLFFRKQHVRPTLNKAVSYLLDYYEKTKNSKAER